MVLRLCPCYKDILWGGDAFSRIFGRGPVPSAESWEAACHHTGSSTITDGPYDGLTLDEAAAAHGRGFYALSARQTRLDVLFKLIDARDRLSLQVHPGDEQAALEGDLGKTELWYTLASRPGAGVYVGLRRPLSPARFEELLRADALEPFLNFIELAPGDAVFLPAGLLHAIGGGLLLAEIQQNSNTTYRVSDWGRLDARGAARELHLDKALLAADLTLPGEKLHKKPHPGGSLLADCPYFQAYELVCASRASNDTDGRYDLLFCVSGSATVDGAAFAAGDTLFVTADTGVYTLSGCATYLKFKGGKEPSRPRPTSGFTSSLTAQPAGPYWNKNR